MISKTFPTERMSSVTPVLLRPRLQELLQTLRLDVTYERGRGNSLYYRDEAGREVEVLDLVGGFGSLLLGHNHPELVAEAQRLLTTGRPVHSQGSHREYAQRLATALNQRTSGDYAVIFGNSGTEAVEVALKHTLLQSKARTFIALDGAFHGKTLGALQLTSNGYYRDAFPVDGFRVRHVQPNDLDSLEAAFEEARSDTAAFIFEPVLGEGGVLPLTPEFVQTAARLCRKHGAVVIADECQTGNGRTGHFLASERLGISPDYILLSKALGGGLAKISACLIRRSHYQDTFDLRHTSTFADDDFSSALALKTLGIIDPKLLASIRRRGEFILERLAKVASAYPDVLREVRGAGLMFGLEFHPFDRSESFLLRFLSSQEDLVKLLTGYFLHVHRVRVLPLLSSPFTLRLQPSAFVTDAEIDRFLHALEDVCAKLRAADIVGLSAFGRQASPAPPPRIPRESARFVAFHPDRFVPGEQDERIPNVAWLCHLVDTNDFVSIEPSFAAVPAGERDLLLSNWVNHAAPVLMGAKEVRSPAGGQVRFHTIMLPFTSSWIKRRLETRDLHLARTLVQQGIDLARELGCQVASLGQYTSIATANGRRLDGGGMGLTSGNSYAVALALDAVQLAMAERDLDPATTTLAIVGAAGNIGRTCAALLGPAFARTMLVGPNTPGSHLRLQRLSTELGDTSTIISTSLSATRHAQVVIAASNAAVPTLRSAHLRKDAIVCDISVPASIHPDTLRNRPDLLAIKGGIARLPGGEDLEVPGFPLPKGQAFACMAEGMLLGMEGISTTAFTGALRPEGVTTISTLAHQHGFRLADFKTKSVLGSDHDIRLSKTPA